jgi:putative sigma-54 modulation protein
MNVSIIGRKIKISPEIRERIEKNMKKLDHFTDHIYDFKLILEKERHTFLAEVNINVKKKIIHIITKSEDLLSAVDTLFDKIEVKIRRYRDKLINKRIVPLKESSVEQEGNKMVSSGFEGSS